MRPFLGATEAEAWRLRLGLDATSESDLVLHAEVIEALDRRASPWPRWHFGRPVLELACRELRTFEQSLSTTLLFLERVTTREPVREEAFDDDLGRAYSQVMAVRAWYQRRYLPQLVRWCAARPYQRPMDLGLLEAYDRLIADPQELQRQARALPRPLRTAGAPSRLAVALLARQRSTNSQRVDLALAQTRAEQRLAARWARYGEWLATTDGRALEEIQRRLPFRITD